MALPIKSKTVLDVEFHGDHAFNILGRELTLWARLVEVVLVFIASEIAIGIVGIGRCIVPALQAVPSEKPMKLIRIAVLLIEESWLPLLDKPLNVFVVIPDRDTHGFTGGHQQGRTFLIRRRTWSMSEIQDVSHLIA